MKWRGRTKGKSRGNSGLRKKGERKSNEGGKRRERVGRERK